MERAKLELRPGSGVLWKLFEDYRLLRADVADEVQEGDLVIAHHPDPEVEPLRYRVSRAWQRKDNGLWCFTASLIGEAPRWGKRPEPKTHDYTNAVCCWGHSLAQRIELGQAIGWGFGLREGDFLLASKPDASKPDATYVIEKVDYESEPPDLWFADVKEKKDG